MIYAVIVLVLLIVGCFIKFRKKITFRQPKYILPIIFLPVVFLFFYVFQSWGATSTKEGTDSTNTVKGLNPDMPGVSKEVSDEQIKNKFLSTQEAYKNLMDSSALTGIDHEQGLNPQAAYSTDEKQAMQARRRLDSLQRALDATRLDFSSQKFSKPVPSLAGSEDLAYYNYPTPTRNVQPKNNPVKQQSSDPEDELEIFRKQLQLVDSMQQAATAPKKDDKKEKKIDSTFRPLPVFSLSTDADKGQSKAMSSTVIKAKISESGKYMTGNRIKIKLQEPIKVGADTLQAGTEVYGIISGFQLHRVNISITQIVLHDRLLTVALDAFDASDGYLGIYIPGANFREFSKDIGTQGTQGLSSVEMAAMPENVTAGVVTQLFGTASSSMSRIISKNKAPIKKSKEIYLKPKPLQ